MSLDPVAQAPAAPSRLGTNIGAQIVARGTWLAASLVLTPYLLDALGPRLFGAWSLIAGSLSVVLLFDLGLGAALTRAVARSSGEGEQDRTAEALGFGLAASGVLAVIFLLAAWALAPPLDRGLDLGLGSTFTHALLLAAAAAALMWLSAPFAAVLDGNLRMDLTGAATSAGSVVFAAVTFVLVSRGAGLLGPVLGLVAYAGVRGIAVGLLSWFAFPRLRPRLPGRDRASARELLGYGALVQASNAAGFVHIETDRWVLATFFSTATVAPFEIGTKIIGVFRLLPSFALAALFPLAVVAHQSGRRDRLDRLYLRATRYLTLGATAGAAVLVAGAAPLVTIWIGRPLDFARDVIWLLAPAFALNLSTGAAALVSRAEGHPGRETRYALLSVVLNVAFTVPLLVLAGRVGAVAGSAIGIFLASGYFFWHFHRSSNRPVRPLAGTLWRPWLAAVAGGAAGLAADAFLTTPATRSGAVVPLATATLAATAAYVVVLTSLRFWGPADRMLAQRLWERVRAG